MIAAFAVSVLSSALILTGAHSPPPPHSTAPLTQAWLEDICRACRIQQGECFELYDALSKRVGASACNLLASALETLSTDGRHETCRVVAKDLKLEVSRKAQQAVCTIFAAVLRGVVCVCVGVCVCFFFFFFLCM